MAQLNPSLNTSMILNRKPSYIKTTAQTKANMSSTVKNFDVNFFIKEVNQYMNSFMTFYMEHDWDFNTKQEDFEAFIAIACSNVFRVDDVVKYGDTGFSYELMQFDGLKYTISVRFFFDTEFALMQEATFEINGRLSNNEGYLYPKI